ncbi:MAG TPA: glutathione-regulated potassium-efflux system oxidoreductase KefF [Polyangiaceae bacterium]|jgi:glutathione-regulated potassium-efflux system ancillary protein KefF|nr:glutathione-regulated potassium-efflux system oxidoreductase KefF [Polyangiaceae bacterium]
MALLVYAHPYPSRSQANRTLLEAVRDLEGLVTHSLYDSYPDFDIDVAKEQAALSAANVIVWQHPMHWYSVPSLLKHWFDKVLLRGWAYGTGGTALHGKQCLWVTTTGGDERAFSPEGMHSFPFASFVPVIEQTARFCGMHWQPPVVLHSAHRTSSLDLGLAAQRYRQSLSQLITEFETKPALEAKARAESEARAASAAGSQAASQETSAADATLEGAQ